MSQQVQSISNRQTVILAGDLNVRVGSREDDKVVGRYGEEVVNDIGERLQILSTT